MTSGPALFKSNGRSGAWGGLFLAWRSRRTEDIFRWQFGDSAAIYWLIERLMSVCFWYVAPCVREPQSDRFAKIPIKMNSGWGQLLKLLMFHLQEPNNVSSFSCLAQRVLWFTEIIKMFLFSETMQRSGGLFQPCVVSAFLLSHISQKKVHLANAG